MQWDNSVSDESLIFLIDDTRDIDFLHGKKYNRSGYFLIEKKYI